MAQAIKKIKVGDETHPIDGAFYLGTLSTVAGSSSSGSYKSVRWYVSDCEGVTAPYNGMRIAIKIPLAGVGTAGAMLSINGNNDADYHPLAYNVNTVLTTHFPVNSIKVFVYDASATMTCYKTAGTSVSVTGVWKADANYDSNTVVTYGTLEYYFRPYNGTNPLYRYKFVALDKDNRVVPLTTTNVSNGTAVTNITPTNVAFRPDKIWWYCTTTTIAASALLGAQILWRSGYNANNSTNGGMAICNFNETVPAYRLIYFCGTYDKSTGLFTLRDGGTASSKNYYKFVPTNTASITLSSYFTSGYDYILVGGTYSSNNYIQLFDNNPMFHFDGTNLVPYDSWASGTVKSVNNVSPDSNGNVSISIPTDTNQTVKGNGTSFGTNASVDIVGGGNVTVTGDATNNKITVSYTTPASLPANGGNAASLGGQSAAYYASVGAIQTNTNQTVKAGTVTFGVNDVVNFVGGGNVTVTGDATNKSIAISYTTPTSLPANGGNADTVDNKHASDFRASTWMPTYADVGALSAATAIPSTYGDVGAASAGHTHTLSIVASTGAANVSLAFGSSYKLTAGGNDTIFKMPNTPTATGYAGTLALSANSYTDGTQSLNVLYTNSAYVSSSLFSPYVVFPGDMYIVADTGVIGATAGSGTLSLYGAEGVFIATSNSTYFDLNSQNTSLNAAGNVSVYASYISICAWGYDGTTNYAGIILSAGNANGRVSIFGSYGIQMSTAGRAISIRTNYTNGTGTVGSNTYGSIYLMAGNILSMTASKDIMLSTQSSSITIQASSSRILISASSSATTMNYGVLIKGLCYSNVYGYNVGAQTNASMVYGGAITVPSGCTIIVNAHGWEAGQQGDIAIVYSTTATVASAAWTSGVVSYQLARATGEAGYWSAQWLNATGIFTNNTAGTRYILFGRRKMTNCYATYTIMRAI